MKIDLTDSHVSLLLAVADDRVHRDPRYKAPDVEVLPNRQQVPATLRMRKLRTWELVELHGEPDQYRLTARGEELTEQARAVAAAETETWGKG